MELNEKEMYEITGGALSWGVVAGVVSAVVYFIGVISGWTNPTRCNN